MKITHRDQLEIISQLKEYMYQIAYYEYTNQYSSGCYAKQIKNCRIRNYRIAAGVLIDMCTTLGIDVENVSSSYCGYEIDFHDLYSFNYMWGTE